ncbi:MAG: SH3 domain-containing protein [Deltaproteobacteria bacterium]|nr:SH3 domain-containing protein [Deltaproteobacteria bacterium]
MVLISFTALAAAKIMSVQVKEGHLRVSPSFLGKIVATLPYGSQVDVQEETGSWAKVSAVSGGSTGWMSVSALSSKRIVLNPGAADVEQAASSRELALAGKGFNAQVEGDFKATHKNADYAAVDKMERINISPAEVDSFVTEGRLTAGGGAQ